MCTSMHSIVYAHDFNRQLIDFDSEYVAAFRRVWLSLIFRNPLAILQHQLCAGALVWLVPPLTYLYTVEREIYQDDLGLSTQSQWPSYKRLTIEIEAIIMFQHRRIRNEPCHLLDILCPGSRSQRAGLDEEGHELVMLYLYLGEECILFCR